MHSKQEIARRKEKLRNDPATKRLAARLGVSLEQFLENIEAPGPVFDRHGDRPVAERLAEIDVIMRKAIAAARERQELRGQKRDGFAGEERQAEKKQKSTLGNETW